MKIGIISDLHLTNRLSYTVVGDKRRKNTAKSYLSLFFQKLVEDKIPYLIIAGDVCNSTMLNPDDEEMLMYFLALIKESKIRTILCLGNHDIDGDKSILSFLNDNYHLYPNLSYSENYVTHYFEDFGVTVVPYCSHHEFIERARWLYKNQEEVILKYNIFVGHVGVKGTLHGSTKSIVGVKLEDINKISSHYDLAILGHHHKFQWINDNSLYPGIPWHTRADEVDEIPGGIIIDLNNIKDVELVENKLSPRFSLLKGYSLERNKIEGMIVKPVIDVENKTEKENLKYLSDIEKLDPYNLIKPRVKKLYLIEENISTSYSKKNKRKALLNTIKIVKVEKSKRKEFKEHTIKIYESLKGD